MSLFALAQPLWKDSMAALQWLHMNVTLRISSGVAGVAFRVTDALNYYAVAVDSAAKTATLSRTLAGTTTTLSTTAFTAGVVNTTVSIDVVVSGSGITATLTLPGVVHLSSSDHAIQFGSIGFVALGTAAFFSIFAETLCDNGGIQCVGAGSGVSCAFACDAGYAPTGGDGTRTCVNGAWSGADLVCSLCKSTARKSLEKFWRASSLRCTSDCGLRWANPL